MELTHTPYLFIFHMPLGPIFYGRLKCGGCLRHFILVFISGTSKWDGSAHSHLSCVWQATCLILSLDQTFLSRGNYVILLMTGARAILLLSARLYSSSFCNMRQKKNIVRKVQSFYRNIAFSTAAQISVLVLWVLNTGNQSTRSLLFLAPCRLDGKCKCWNLVQVFMHRWSCVWLNPNIQSGSIYRNGMQNDICEDLKIHDFQTYMSLGGLQDYPKMDLVVYRRDDERPLNDYKELVKVIEIK